MTKLIQTLASDNNDYSVFFSMDKINEVFTEYNRTLAEQEFFPSELDYSRVDFHIELLKNFVAIDNSCVSIFDLHKREHVYYSQRFENVLGYDLDKIKKNGDDLNYQRIHPNDLIEMTEAGTYFLKFARHLPDEKKKTGKLIMEYRMLNAKGEYIRVIEQQMALELDILGNVWLALSILDLSPNQEINQPFSCRLVDMQNAEVYQWPPEQKEELNKPDLSKREKEILHLVSKGLVSKQIADKLFISVNTVNTHRQNIISKMNVGNTTEAIDYAKNLGLIA
jgi:DNA-binding CsgD family transcriptional regulator